MTTTLPIGIDLNDRNKNFTYSNPFILLCINLFLVGLISYRGCMRVCKILSRYYCISTPHFTTIRQWILRFGYYTLTKAKEFRNDWVYIVDYTIGVSNNKCLAILGVPLKSLRKQTFCLNLEDVTMLHLSVTPKATWEMTYNALVKASKQVGIPIEIISDYGADVKKGIEEFCSHNKGANFFYDFTHMAACRIKGILINDLRWQEFINKLTSCKNQTQQSLLSFLSPPSQRAKSRFLNISQIVNWGKRLLQYQKNGDYSLIAKSIVEKKEQNYNIGVERIINAEIVQESKEMFEEKFGWLSNFKREIKQYNQYVKIVSIIKQEIINNGISKKSIREIKQKFSKIKLNKESKNLKDELIAGILNNLPDKSKDNEAYLGTSDIIETLFGKYKYFCAEGAHMGITQSVLIMAASTAKLDVTNIRNALDYCVFSKIDKWAATAIGESVFSKRKKGLKCTEKT